MTITLFDHQRRCVEAMMHNPRFGLWLEPGMGKTITTLEAIRRAPMRTVVVCPKSIMPTAWLKDAKHFPDLRTKIIAGDTPEKRRRNIAADDWDVGIINFDQFKTTKDDLLRAGVRRLVIDESSKIKTWDSKITLAVHYFADRVRSVWLLSGTPAPNSPVEYFGQIRAMRPDICGDLYWKWVYQISTPMRDKVWVKGRPKEVILGYSQSEAQRIELERQLGLCSIAMRKEDALDLPAQTDIVMRLELGVDEFEAYTSAVNLLRAEIGDEVVKMKSESALIKIRQITGGFVLNGPRALRIGSTKLDALADIFDQLGPQPCLIWAEFRHEIDAIEALCKERGESVAIIDGRTSHDAGSITERFQAGEISRLICQPQAAGHGITLTRASYAVYYSLGFSYENFKQSRDRIHRAGQTKPCTYYILLAEDTVDEAAYGVVRGKGKASDALLAVLSGNMKDLSE